MSKIRPVPIEKLTGKITEDLNNNNVAPAKVKKAKETIKEVANGVDEPKAPTKAKAKNVDELIYEAIQFISDRKGSSLQSIRKYVLDQVGSTSTIQEKKIKMKVFTTIKLAVTEGLLKQPAKFRYLLSDEGRKNMKEKARQLANKTKTKEKGKIKDQEAKVKSKEKVKKAETKEKKKMEKKSGKKQSVKSDNPPTKKIKLTTNAKSKASAGTEAPPPPQKADGASKESKAKQKPLIKSMAARKSLAKITDNSKIRRSTVVVFPKKGKSVKPKKLIK